MKAVVDVLDAIVDVEAMLIGLAQRLRLRNDVRDVSTTLHFSGGPTVDLYADAEMNNGEALSWGLLAVFKDSEWLIETAVRRNHAGGQDVVHQLPDRFAVTTIELAAELESAVTVLVGVWSDGGEMFAGEGYGP
jgi:hypothetical protein